MQFLWTGHVKCLPWGEELEYEVAAFHGTKVVQSISGIISLTSDEWSTKAADNIFIRNLLNEYIDTLIRISFVTSNTWSGLV